MASFTIPPYPEFMAGATVSLYANTGQRPPLGAALMTAIVQPDGTTTFTGLAEGAHYTAGVGSPFNGTFRGVDFTTGYDPTNPTGAFDARDLATDAEVTDAIGRHNSDTTGVHGIADTATVMAAVGGAALGGKFSRGTFGTFDEAVVASFIGNRTPATTQVMGTTDPSATNERGSVAVYIDNSTRNPNSTVNSAATTFTASSVTFGVGVDLSGVLPGMLVDVGNASPFVPGVAGTAVGTVQSVSGQTVTLNFQGWRLAGAGAATPANGTRAYVNRQDQIWALNANVFSQNAGDGQGVVGFELGVQMARDDSSVALASSEGAGSRGYDVIALASAGKPLFGMTARGRFKYGYSASGMISGADGKGAGFVYHSAHQFTPGSSVEAAFLDDGSNALVGFKKRAAAGADATFSVHVAAEVNPRFWFDASGKQNRGDGTNAPDESNERTVVGGITRTKFSQIVHATGSFITSRNTAPADASLAANEMAVWFDPTNGASKLMVKAKQADGAVKTASVALA